jgi:hypothetical protein
MRKPTKRIFPRGYYNDSTIDGGFERASAQADDGKRPPAPTTNQYDPKFEPRSMTQTPAPELGLEGVKQQQVEFDRVDKMDALAEDS